MSKHQRTLEHIFAHPMNMNIKWTDVVHMFEHFGAEVKVAHGGREHVSLNGEDSAFHIPHGKMIDSKDELVQIRHFCERAGIAPGSETS